MKSVDREAASKPYEMAVLKAWSGSAASSNKHTAPTSAVARVNRERNETCNRLSLTRSRSSVAVPGALSRTFYRRRSETTTASLIE
jgi:hypothetical protein